MAAHSPPSFTDLSHELLCHVLQYLPLKEVLSMSMQCKTLQHAVDMHLRLRKYIDFCEGKLYGYMSPTITDDHIHSLFQKCPHVETVYGLHPLKVERRRLRKRSALTVPGIVEALALCRNLRSVETSDLRLFEAIMQNLPKLEIIGHFQNRDGVFPPSASQRLKLQPYPRISSLHLFGVEVPELTAMPRLEHLHLQCVRFTKLQPFRAFLAQNLKTFVMKHCMGPTLALRYLSLIIALSSSPSLSRLELVRVPLPGGIFQRAVEDAYRHNGFINLKTLVIAGCKGVIEADVGHLMIVSSKKLESVCIQPSLTRDSLFVSLSFAQCEFPKLKSIHLGYVDNLNGTEEWSNDVLVSVGLAEVPDTPSSLTDSGMKVISQLFPNIKSMSVSNCPHLMAMDQWSPNEGGQSWRELKDLTLQRCHCLQLPSFALFLAFLPKIEVLILNDMFREPPKGCSHVGLSAGTGLGMSSAVVSNQDEHIAVQGHQQDFELQHDENAENDDLMDRDFMEVDNDENPDQHIMVLQQEFFDDERRIVPPPVRHMEDVIDIDDQNDPENRIRRELNNDYNDDYRVALNIETFQVSDMENSDEENVGKRGYSISSDEDGHSKDGAFLPNLYVENLPSSVFPKKRLQWSSDDGEEEVSLLNTDVDKSKGCKKGSFERFPKKKRLPLSSDEEEDLVIDKATDKHRKQEDSRKKKLVSFKKSCHHSQECRKRCSKGFDPNQPSTSRDGNCLDCTCSREHGPREVVTQNTKENSAVGLPKGSDRKKHAFNTKNSKVSSSKPLKKSGIPTNEYLNPNQPSSSRDDNCTSSGLNNSKPTAEAVTKNTNENNPKGSLKKHFKNPDNSTEESSVKENIASDKVVIKEEDVSEDPIEEDRVKEFISTKKIVIKEEDTSKDLAEPLVVHYRENPDFNIKNLKVSPYSNLEFCEEDLLKDYISTDKIAIKEEVVSDDSTTPPSVINPKNDKVSSKKPLKKSCKCSGKYLNPNQPSTSRGGNCLDCTSSGENASIEAVTRNTKEHNAVAPPKVHYRKRRAFKPKKYKLPTNKSLKKSQNSTEEVLVKESDKKEDNNLEGDAVQGPLTRHRKRVLDADNMKKSLPPSKRSLRSLSDQQRNAPTTSFIKNKNIKPSKQNNKPEKKNIPPEKQSRKPKECKATSASKIPTSVRETNRRTSQELNETEKFEDDKDNRKHKSHRHSKRCKRKKCDKLCQKHYPLTRSKRNKCIRDGHNVVSQGTQATSADIRRSLRKQRNCPNRCRRRTCTSSHRRSHNHVSARQQFKRHSHRKTNAELNNKSTSTSDPLMEDDAVQILRLVSETLISVTIISCGISDVVIDHCQSLTHVEVQACRILKMFQLHYCPPLKRLNVSQCPKLSLEAIVPEVISFVATKRILISFEPCMQKYNPSDSEKLIFSKTPLDQSVILFHDFTDNANENLQAVAKENLFRWMEVAQKLYYSPSFWIVKHRKRKLKSREVRARYPYGHNLRRIHGSFTLPADVDPDATEFRYEILTNDHIFAAALESVPWDSGFPPPETYNACTEDDALLSMIETELTEKKLSKRKKIMSFYIPVCESNLLTE